MQTPTDNRHEAEERGIERDGDADEESKYSSVLRQDRSSVPVPVRVKLTVMQTNAGTISIAQANLQAKAANKKDVKRSSRGHVPSRSSLPPTPKRERKTRKVSAKTSSADHEPQAPRAEGLLCGSKTPQHKLGNRQISDLQNAPLRSPSSNRFAILGDENLRINKNV
jgi:hypothetical protein